MGAILSNLFGRDAGSLEGPETSAIKKFSSLAQWEFHFNSMKESSLMFRWVDELPDVAKELNVTAFPTSLYCLKRGKEVERIVGAKKDELEN